MGTLATKYRPMSFEDVTEQENIKIILQNQIKNNSIKNAYLFCGGAGTGKTTTARIFAKEINKGQGNPVEIDAASNNGVEQVRTIIEDAKFKPLDSEYKVYILDEVHMLSIGAWNAMLKLLEEPPKTTIFLLCTTDPQKIPATILSRVQRYDFQRISYQGIVDRLLHIIEKENNEICNNYGNDFTEEEAQRLLLDYEKEAINYIAKIADGGMRDAISLLDKCIAFDNKLTVANVIKALGVSDYDNLLELITAILHKDDKEKLSIIESVYQDGKDLKQFIKQLLACVLDICKYLIYNDYSYIKIPNTISLEKFKVYNYTKFTELLDNLIALNQQIKYETNPKVLIQSQLLLFNKKG